MMLRASNDLDRKRGDVCPRAGPPAGAPQLTTVPPDVDGHRLLDLFVYDVWQNLWGGQFADERVVGRERAARPL